MTLNFEVGLIFMFVGVSGEFGDVTCSYILTDIFGLYPYSSLHSGGSQAPEASKCLRGFIKTQC